MRKQTGNNKRSAGTVRGTAAAAAAALLLSLSACGAKTAASDGKPAAETETASLAEEQTAGETGTETEAADGGTGETYTPEITPFEDIFHSFTLNDTDGNEVTEAVLSDSDLTMVNIWATFCNPCLKEMPDLGALNKEYQEAGKSFQIIGLVMDGFKVEADGRITEDPEMIETARSLITQTGADYLHLIPTGDFAYSLVASGQAQSVPTTLFVDSQGNMIGKPVLGSRSADNWKVIIDEKLEKTGQQN
ncbi:MAG: TlpA disulfide reductase family protein [Eubacteriales bacterium]|nr:TlpA disulfide reductase family protein [Eubacteriales bacterium]